MKALVHGISFKDSYLNDVQLFLNLLSSKNIDAYFSDTFALYLIKKGIVIPEDRLFNHLTELPEADVAFSIGGDGTFLETLTFIGKNEIPLLGVNTGRLGFLATVSVTDVIHALDCLVQKKYTIGDRSLIHLDTDSDLFGNVPFALNEFAITKRDSSSMIIVHTYINGEFLNSYWADGLVVATPTGSTGYALSCGGPMVYPTTKSFIIAPICPHNLNVRPLIVPDSSVISFEIEGRSKNFLVSLDSRSKTVDTTVSLTVKKEIFKAKVIQFENDSFFKTLRNKMNWGIDSRN